MSAPHFFAETVDGDVVVLTDEEAAHARGALRIRAGETITVSDGRGAVVTARARAAGATLEADVLDRRVEPQPRPRVVVFPAVPKSGKLDLIVQKLTELGVEEIRPWPAVRSVARWDASKRRAQGDRLRAIAHEAAKQSRRAWLPSVADPAPVSDLPAVSFVLHEVAEDRLGGMLPDSAPETVGVVVGPEGGLTEDEVRELTERGARAAGLGPQILRAETASFVGATLLLARYGRLG